MSALPPAVNMASRYFMRTRYPSVRGNSTRSGGLRENPTFRYAPSRNGTAGIPGAQMSLKSIKIAGPPYAPFYAPRRRIGDHGLSRCQRTQRPLPQPELFRHPVPRLIAPLVGSVSQITPPEHLETRPSDSRFSAGNGNARFIGAIFDDQE